MKPCKSQKKSRTGAKRSQEKRLKNFKNAPGHLALFCESECSFRPFWSRKWSRVFPGAISLPGRKTEPGSNAVSDGTISNCIWGWLRFRSGSRNGHRKKPGSISASGSGSETLRDAYQTASGSGSRGLPNGFRGRFVNAPRGLPTAIPKREKSARVAGRLASPITVFLGSARRPASKADLWPPRGVNRAGPLAES